MPTTLYRPSADPVHAPDRADPVLGQCCQTVNTIEEPAGSPVLTHVPGYSSRFAAAEVDAFGTGSAWGAPRRRYHLGLGDPAPTAWDEADAWMAMRADGVR
jgi:hypothetical protein